MRVCPPHQHTHTHTVSLSRVSWWLFLGLCQCQLQTSPTQQHQRENIKKNTARTRTRSAGPSRRCMQIHPYAWGGQHLEEKLQQNWRVCIMRVCTHTHTATPLPASRACMCARSVINYLARSAPHNMEQAHMCVCVPTCGTCGPHNTCAVCHKVRGGTHSHTMRRPAPEAKRKRFVRHVVVVDVVVV